MKPRSGPLVPDDLVLSFTCERDNAVGSTCPNYQDTIQHWWVSVDCYSHSDDDSDTQLDAGAARVVLETSRRAPMRISRWTTSKPT